ncbi:MAG: nicotinate phosphoribosyltransferase [Deltaproteobacteria bacterium RBG_13_49_15]|nr:MAG: nicotinate phosphoribosyltransferase [Deltaproteobacteria bacterium RBG_13_49_15]
MHRAGPLFTDLYELTMAACYHSLEMFSKATFSLFIRAYPPKRNYFVAAGLEDALRELESYRFYPEELDFLASTRRFPDNFLSYLEHFRFSGMIYALPEGSIFFTNEPILEVSAPIIESQILETYLLNTIGFQTLIASKAARCVYAAQNRPLIDFSLRRVQGLDAGQKVARSTYIAGFEGTSNVLAGKIYGIPISGTMAHSFVMAFDSELEAFMAFSNLFPKNTVLLIDTYDTVKGAHLAVLVAKKMEAQGEALNGVRLDSGDYVKLSNQVRRILDEAGHPNVKIIATGGFDETKITDLLARGAAIDAFGVGTKMGVSSDAPYLDIVYKMVHYNGRDVRKLSPGKKTLAGEKQIFRKKDEKGRFKEDVLGLRGETVGDADPLLEKVMEDGKILCPHPSLIRIREHFKKDFSGLPEKYRSLSRRNFYPVTLSARFRALQDPINK